MIVHAYLRPIAAAGVLALTLAAFVPAGAAELTYTGSLQFATGNYIFTERSTGLYLFSGITALKSPFSFSASIPIILQNTPWITYTGSGLLPSGGTRETEDDTRGRVRLPDTTDYADLGLGDMFLRGDLELVSMRGLRPGLQISGSVKVPFADPYEGFGTGEWDAGLGLSTSISAGGFLFLAEGIYWFLGDLPGLELKDVLSYGLSAGRLFSGGSIGLIASFIGYTRTIDDVDPPMQASLGFTYLQDSGRSLNGSCAAGLTESTSDISVSFGWQIPL
jgi:hypothetical protein